MKTLLLLTAVLMTTSSCSSGLTRKGYEEATHAVIKEAGPIQLREYPTLQLVQTEMVDSNDGGFMRLFRYIDKGNEKEQKIAMTSPVFVEMENNKRKMSFVLPADMASEDVPAPVSAKVKHVENQPGLYATYRYNGRVEVSPIEVYEKLEAWMEEHGYIQNGKEIHAFYDPPWTPAPMRRNELLIPVVKKGKGADNQ
jgi:hypothetical protein